MERKLNSLLTKYRTWIQETGINILHASFGFLEWVEPNETEPSFAPLVLLPVEIEKVKTREGSEFWVKMAGDKTETNLVLAEKFRREFGIDLPKFGSGSIEQYLQEISAASPTTMWWRVRRQAAFGIFPSARMAMYQDLDTKKTNFGRSNILSRLFGGGQPTMQHAKLLAQYPAGDQQRLADRRQIGMVGDKLADPSLELGRPNHADLEAEVAQRATQVTFDVEGFRLQQLPAGQQHPALLAGQSASRN